ncbi:GNAT family N-acetyltransferase [Kurthia sibirica]|nr:GNAT family N-acetyltransferase [Kurthia sibirica]GEK33601.1 hypothetical protein KSI01_11340 [Kurthia sibirica]
MFQSKVITTQVEFEQYQSTWEAIIQKIDNNNPFIEFTWLTCWWQTVGNKKNIEIYVISEQQTIIGFIPLEKKNINHKETEYSFMAVGDASYMDIVAEEQYKKKILQFLVTTVLKTTEKTTISLHGLVENAPTSMYLEWLLQKEGVTFDFTRTVAPNITINELDKTAYFHKRRKLFGLNRLEQSLEQQGEICFRQVKVEELDKMYQLFDDRWQMKNDTSGFTTREKRQFHRKLIEETNLVTIDGLFLDDELLAFSFGYRLRGTYLGCNIAFEPAFACFGLGNILDKKLITNSFNEEDKIFDFSIGFEKYKFNWATETLYLRYYTFGNKAVQHKVTWQNTKNLIKQQIKKNDKLVAFKRNTLGKWLYYLKKPLRIWQPIKNAFAYHCTQIYVLPAHSMEKENRLNKKIPLMQLYNTTKNEDCIMNSFKGSVYYEMNKTDRYTINKTLIHKKYWLNSIVLPKKSLFIDGVVTTANLANWNDETIYCSANRWDIDKKKLLNHMGFTKVTAIYTIKFLNIQKFYGKNLILKSAKRYEFIFPEKLKAVKEDVK